MMLAVKIQSDVTKHIVSTLATKRKPRFSILCGIVILMHEAFPLDGKGFIKIL